MSASEKDKPSRPRKIRFLEHRWDQSDHHRNAIRRIDACHHHGMAIFAVHVSLSSKDIHVFAHAPKALRQGAKRLATRLALAKLRFVTQLDTKRFGGAERDRTADPLLAKQVLSQLSYSPTSRWVCQIQPKMVGPGRLELPTSRLSGVRSNHLSYGPIPGRTRPQAGFVILLKKEKRGRRISPSLQDA